MKSKNKFSSEVMFPVNKEYFSSNLSRSQFCSQQGIKPYILQYWLKKYKSTNEKTPSSSFSPIQIKDTQESLTDQNELNNADRQIVIKTSTGLEIQIPV